jgi:hypothetical protein
MFLFSHFVDGITLKSLFKMQLLTIDLSLQAKKYIIHILRSPDTWAIKGNYEAILTK